MAPLEPWKLAGIVSHKNLLYLRSIPVIPFEEYTNEASDIVENEDQWWIYGQYLICFFWTYTDSSQLVPRMFRRLFVDSFFLKPHWQQSVTFHKCFEGYLPDFIRSAVYARRYIAFLVDCDFDFSGKILQKLYSAIKCQQTTGPQLPLLWKTNLCNWFIELQYLYHVDLNLLRTSKFKSTFWFS